MRSGPVSSSHSGYLKPRHRVPPIEGAEPGRFSEHLRAGNRDRLGFAFPFWLALERQNHEFRDSLRRHRIEEGGRRDHERCRPDAKTCPRSNTQPPAIQRDAESAGITYTRISTVILHTRIHGLGRVIDLIA